VEGLKAMTEQSPANLTLDDQDRLAHECFPIPLLALGCCLIVLRCMGGLKMVNDHLLENSSGA